ncbi:hypothetical protein LXA43DRAFT_1100193 [Ganoderma leucocontextum]|nr:hypothetical protein LXA43DRAFT_1100193 [Ganoderma leucocontextum]
MPDNLSQGMKRMMADAFPPAKRARHDPPTLPTPRRPVDVPPPSYVRFGMVHWTDNDQDNTLQDQVLFAAALVWPADNSLLAAYNSPAINMGDRRFALLEFKSHAKAARFVELWYKHRARSDVSKVSANVMPSAGVLCTIQLLLWNVHGNLALKARTAWFRDEISRWDVVLLQETHLRPGQAQLPLPRGYDCVALAHPESADMTHQQGGLLAVYKVSLGLKHVTPPAETELMLLRVGALYLVNIYLPPTSSPWNPDPCRTPI